MRDPHRVLGVRPDASKDEIRRAYRRIAFATHPDRNPSSDAAASFDEARQAYEALLAADSAQGARAAGERRRAAHTAAVEAAARRATARFADALSGHFTSRDGEIEVDLGGAKVRVKVRT